MATTEDSPSNDETTVKKEFASFVAVGDGNETKFDIFKAGFISGRNASTMEQSKDAATITDKVLFPDKPWRVICRVVAEDGSKTAATFTRYFKYEVEAEDFILSLDGDDPNAVFCCGVWYDKSKGPCPNCGRTEQALQPTPVTITVNMREHRVEGGTISYERVAELAGKPGATHLTMTYHWTGPGRKSEISGSLIPGERALVRDGMHFCATNTSNA